MHRIYWKIQAQIQEKKKSKKDRKSNINFFIMVDFSNPFDEFMKSNNWDTDRINDLARTIGKQSKSELLLNLNHLAVERLKEVIPFAAKFADVPVKNLEQSITQISVLDDLLINGYTWSPDGDHFNIEINVGLSVFCAQVANVFISFIGRIDSSGQRRGNGLISKNEAASQIKKLIQTYVAGQPYYELPSAELERELMLFSVSLHGGIESFVVGHELGHVIISVSKKGREFNQLAIGLMMEQLVKIKSLENPGELANQWGTEVAADLIGLMSILQEGPPDYYSAIELFFIICELLEEEKHIQDVLEIYNAYEAAGQDTHQLDALLKNKNPFLKTHPPAAMRLNFLRQLTEHFPEQMRLWGKEAEILGNEVLKVK